MYTNDIIFKSQREFANSSYVRCHCHIPFHCDYLHEKMKEVVGMIDHGIVILKRQHITCMTFCKHVEWSFASVGYAALRNAVQKEVVAMIRRVASCMHEAIGKWSHPVIIVLEGHPREARCHVLQPLMGLSRFVSSDPCLSVARPSKALVITRALKPCVKREASKVPLIPPSSKTRLGSVNDGAFCVFASSMKVRSVSSS